MHLIFTVIFQKISSISLFDINKVNPFPALAATFPLIFLSNLFNTNLSKISLAKETSTSNTHFLFKLPNDLPRDPPD